MLRIQITFLFVCLYLFVCFTSLKAALLLQMINRQMCEPLLVSFFKSTVMKQNPPHTHTQAVGSWKQKCLPETAGGMSCPKTMPGHLFGESEVTFG